MLLEFKCIFVRHLIFVAGEGQKSIDTALRHSDFVPGLNVLRDTREVALPDVMDFKWFKSDFKDTYAAKHRVPIQQAKFAWVVNSKLDYSKAHLWALVNRTTHGQKRRSFRQISDAFTWLDIPPDYKIDYGHEVYSI